MCTVQFASFPAGKAPKNSLICVAQLIATPYDETVGSGILFAGYNIAGILIFSVVVLPVVCSNVN